VKKGTIQNPSSRVRISGRGTSTLARWGLQEDQRKKGGKSAKGCSSTWRQWYSRITNQNLARTRAVSPFPIPARGSEALWTGGAPRRRVPNQVPSGAGPTSRGNLVEYKRGDWGLGHGFWVQHKRPSKENTIVAFSFKQLVGGQIAAKADRRASLRPVARHLRVSCSRAVPVKKKAPHGPWGLAGKKPNHGVKRLKKYQKKNRAGGDLGGKLSK